MDYKTIAQAALQMVESANVVASRQNLLQINAVHVMLVRIINGDLIVAEKSAGEVRG